MVLIVVLYGVYASICISEFMKKEFQKTQDSKIVTQKIFFAHFLAHTHTPRGVVLIQARTGCPLSIQSNNLSQTTRCRLHWRLWSCAIDTTPRRSIQETTTNKQQKNKQAKPRYHTSAHAHFLSGKNGPSSCGELSTNINEAQ